MPNPCSMRAAQPSLAPSRSAAARTFSIIPVAKNALTSAVSPPATRSTNSTSSP